MVKKIAYTPMNSFLIIKRISLHKNAFNVLKNFYNISEIENISFKNTILTETSIFIFRFEECSNSNRDMHKYNQNVKFVLANVKKKKKRRFHENLKIICNIK